MDLQEVGKSDKNKDHFSELEEQVRNLTEVLGISKEETIEEKKNKEKKQRLND